MGRDCIVEFERTLGLKKKKQGSLYINLPNSTLVGHTVKRGIGNLTKDGSLVVLTGKHTGRSAKDKYVVKSPKTRESIWWENNINEMTPETFQQLKGAITEHFNQEGRDVYTTERSVGSDKEYSIGVRVVSTHPNHILFSNYLFRGPSSEKYNEEFLILHAPEFQADTKKFGTKSETVITTCFDTNTTLICGTLYAGEIKKSMFAVMNYVLPSMKILPMHSGASMLPNKETSVFFGLSGTGKTTLSTDKGSLLIGDDEHGLSDGGIFNFEGGCYAKTYKLAKDTEPDIYAASSRFGSLLENVVVNERTGSPDFFDKSISENGRSSYPLTFIGDIIKSARGDVPKHIFFLCADAFGVLPPVARLTQEQAMFYFVLGYTAKLAGTEIGVVEPQATFSPCFGAPFMLRKPNTYAELLGHYLKKHGIQVWLINTGWTAGPYGQGHRFPIHVTREIIRAIQHDELVNTTFDRDGVFGFDIPHHVRDVPTSMLHPRGGWERSEKYDEEAKKLAASFHKQVKNFGSFYEEHRKGSPTYGG